MFDIGFGEIVLIVIVALLVFGPDKLPGLIRSTYATLNKVKKSTVDFKERFEDELALHELNKKVDSELKSSGFIDLKREIENLPNLSNKNQDS